MARNAISLSRQHGFATALGMGSGACIFALIALLGLQAVFTAVPVAFWLHIPAHREQPFRLNVNTYSAPT